MSLKGKLIVGAWGVLSACVAAAMPTKAEFQKVLPLVREISADDVAAVKSGKMTPLEAGNNAFARAKDTSIDEASRYLFHESAFAHYVRAAEYDKAAEVVEALKAFAKCGGETAKVAAAETGVKAMAPDKASEQK